MVNIEIILVTFFAAKDGKALYSKQKQDRDLTVAQTMNILLPNSDINWINSGKPLDHSVSSVQFSRSVLSDSLQPHESQHARPPCPSPTPRVHSNSCPSSRWCHPAISSSVVPFSSCLQSLPASESFPMSQIFAWGGQSIGVLASTSVLPMNTQDWFPLGWTGWISLQSKELSRVFSNTTVQKHQLILLCSALFIVQLSHPCMTTGKTIVLTSRTFVDKVMSLPFNMLSRLVNFCLLSFQGVSIFSFHGCSHHLQWFLSPQK